MALYHHERVGQVIDIIWSGEGFWHSLPMMLLLYVAGILLIDIENGFLRRSTLRALWESVKSGIILLIVEAIVLLMNINTMADISRGTYFCVALVNSLLFFGVHILLRYYLLKVHRNRKNVPQMFLVTTSDRLQETLKGCASDWNYRLCGIAVLDENQVGTKYDLDGDVEVVATYSNMYSYVQSHAVDEVYINVPYNTGHSTFKVAMEFEKMGVNVHVSIELLKHFEGRRKSIGIVGSEPVITFSGPQYDWRMMLLKRLMDIVGGIVGLLITALVTVVLAIPLLVESPGPLFFGQNRVGKNGRIFKMYKFRSMYKDAEERKKELMEQNEMGGPMFKMKDDPRITKVGKFIRATSIDELPQFWNVLKGDMSLVGTRPPTVDEFEQYEASQKRRLSAKPGITGLWQVSGRNDISDFEDVVKMDLQYIDNWSLWLDIRILFKTLLVVLRKGGE
ncbi:MAG: sugar transferase [Lachnospiraceae bacterium]|nr:sugar transferase [Lachnospiraceae bacterium]